MARVDFYIMNQPGMQHRQTFACRLAEKAYRLDNTVHIQTANHADAEHLDELLWTFRDGSFVPHDIVATGEPVPASPITIGSADVGVGPRDLLINLCDEIPPFAETFPRVAELVSADDECKLMSRKRFAQYRDLGHTLETHNV
jgi:DNA polymerase-3 subunit chi